VPTTALRQAQEGVGTGRGAGSATFVYRLRGQNAERAPVNLGLVDEAAGVAEVLAGLEPGDRVIVGNVSGVGQGTTVQILGGEGAGPAGRQAAGGPRPASDSSRASSGNNASSAPRRTP
jgi:hypothetical protein